MQTSYLEAPSSLSLPPSLFLSLSISLSLSTTFRLFHLFPADTNACDSDYALTTTERMNVHIFRPRFVLRPREPLRRRRRRRAMQPLRTRSFILFPAAIGERGIDRGKRARGEIKEGKEIK